MLSQIYDNYPAVFDERASKPVSSQYREFSKKWGWKKTLFSIAQDDITKVKKIQKTHLSTVMEFLSYLYDKNEAEESEMKFQESLRKK